MIAEPWDTCNAHWRSEWEAKHRHRWLVVDKSHYLKPPEPPPVRGPRLLPESNESVKALRALQTQIDALKENT